VQSYDIRVVVGKTDEVVEIVYFKAVDVFGSKGRESYYSPLCIMLIGCFVVVVVDKLVSEGYYVKILV